MFCRLISSRMVANRPGAVVEDCCTKLTFGELEGGFETRHYEQNWSGGPPFRVS